MAEEFDHIERITGQNAANMDGLPALEPDHPLPTAVMRSA